MKGFLVLLVVTLGGMCAEISSLELSGPTITQVLRDRLNGYDRIVRPFQGSESVEVEISLYALRLYDFSDINDDFKIDFYLRQKWTDPRLNYENVARDAKIKGGHELINKIWIPDTFFPSDKAGYRAQITVPNAFVFITSNGTVFMSQRFTTHTACTGGLAFFPMDRHLCTLDVESYGYNTNDIRYKWTTQRGRLGVGTSLPGFTMARMREYSQDITLTTGNYSRLNIEFVMDRKVSGFIWRFYLPIMMVTICSFLPFFLAPTTVVPRILISLFTVCVGALFITIVSLAFIPRTGNLTSLDVFDIVSFTFIVSAFGIVTRTVFLIDGPKSTTQDDNIESPAKLYDQNNVGKVQFLDKLGCLILPLFYLVFNALYFLVTSLFPSSLID